MQSRTLEMVFEKGASGVDACCGGDAPLCEAARRDGASVDALLAALDALIPRAEAR